MRKKKNKQLIVNVYNGLWLLFKDNPNKKFAESKLQKLYKKKTKKDPLPVLSSLEKLLNENKIVKASKDRYCLKLGETLSEGIVVKTSKSSVFISDSSGEIIKIKKEVRQSERGKSRRCRRESRQMHKRSRQIRVGG